MRYLLRSHALAEPSWRRLLRWSISASAHYSGVVWALHEVFPRDGALILFAHRVAEDFDDWLGGIPPDLFERQIAWLARRFRFLSLDDLVDHIRRHEPVPRNSVVLTFDDGFVDNYSVALPILERYDVRPTLYLVTDSIESGELPWPQRLAWVISRTSLRTLTLTDAAQLDLPLRSVHDRQEALKTLKEVRKTLCLRDQLGMFGEVVDRCGVETPKNRMLSWDQVRDMHKRGVTVGSHTVYHSFMKRLPLDDARVELQGSKSTIEGRLGARVRHFCFPHGSYGGAVGRIAEEVGYESYFVPKGSGRTNDHHRSPFRLRRLGLSDDEFPVLALTTSRLFDVFRPDRGLAEKD